MEKEQVLNPEESLNLITETIVKTKENIRENSFYFLLWGWLIALASFVVFILQTYIYVEYPFIPLPVSGIIGIIVTLLHYNKNKIKGTQTYLGYFLSRLWAVLGVCFFLVVFISISLRVVPFSYTMVVAGIGTLVSGLTMKFKPLTIGGLFFFLAAVFSVFVSDQDKVLLHGISIIIGYLIPGYLLKSSKTENV